MLFGGRCAYCGELPEKGWHADHVEPIYRKIDRVNGKIVATGVCFNPENDTQENLVPACAPCNLFKSVYSVEVFREEIKKQADRARKSSVNFRTAERFGMIELVDKPVIFWFEQYQGDANAN
ncbi:TPA: HNH endonuclease [Proteus mirabilis]|nr:HNH endonuclease [Proteus mirabilis]